MKKNHRKSLGFFLLLFFCVLVRIFHGSRRTMCAFHFPPLFIWLVCIVSHLCSVCMCPLLFSGKRNPLSSHLSASAAARSSCSLLFSSCCNGGLPVVFVDRVLIGIPMNLFRNKWNLVYTNIITRYAKLLTRQKAATTKKKRHQQTEPSFIHPSKSMTKNESQAHSTFRMGPKKWCSVRWDRRPKRKHR